MAVQRERVIRAAEKHVAKGRLEAAIREYRKVLSDHPDDVGTLNRLGDLYARIEHTDEAVELFQRIAESYTDDGFFVKAIAIYKKIIKLDPTRLEVYERLAELYHKQGLVNEARTQYQVLADYYLKHDNATSAVAIYRKMVELEPENPSHHAKLAELYQQQGFVDKAIDQYRTIAELMLDAGHPQQASQVYVRALDVDAQDVGFITEAARRLHEAGHTAEAARFLIRATELNPEAREVATAIGLAPEEEEPAAEPEPVQAAPADEAAAEPEPEPEPEPIEPPRADAGLAQTSEDEIVLDLDEGEPDLAAALEEAEEAVEERPEPEPEPAAESLEATQTAEIELDLDDVFELEMEEDEEESPSLVRPPADMAEGQVGRAFLREEEEVEEELAGEAEAEAEMEAGFDLEEAPEEDEEEDTATTEPMWLEEEAAGRDEEGTGTGVTQVEADFLERTAAELHPPESPPADADDLVAEAEVLVKYDMEEKAEEKLAEALRLDADHLGAHALLLDIEAMDGDVAAVRSRAAHVRELAQAENRYEVWERAREKLAHHGYEIEEDTLVSTPGPEPEPPAEAEPESQPFSLGENVEEETVPSTPPAPESAPEPAEPPAPRRRVRPKSDERINRLLADLVADVAPRRRKKRRPPQAETAASAKSPEAPEPSETGHPLPSTPDDLTLHGIFDEVEVGDGSAPFTPPVAPESGEEPEPETFDPERDLDRSPVEMIEEDTGVSWLDEVEAVTPEETGAPGSEIYDDEDDFFDLAAELEQELSDEDLFEAGEEDLAAAPEEQTLEEIVAGFKKGVSENLSPEDFDTHFNLGIAYREMGLLDEAIGEFQVAAKSRVHLVECCSMLGLSFLEKGLPELATKWYQRGLQTSDLTEEETLGLLYDMGNAYLAAGDSDSAQKTFVEAYGINSNYRDVVAKLEELRS